MGPVWVISYGKQVLGWPCRHFCPHKVHKHDWRLKEVCQVPRLLQLMKSSIINHTFCRQWFRNTVLQNKWDASSPGKYTAGWNLSLWEGSQVLGKKQSVAISVGLRPHQEAWEEGCEEGTEKGCEPFCSRAHAGLWSLDTKKRPNLGSRLFSLLLTDSYKLEVPNATARWIQPHRSVPMLGHRPNLKALRNQQQNCSFHREIRK